MSTISPCRDAIAAMIMSASPGCLPAAHASASIRPAIIADSRSNERTRSLNCSTNPRSQAESSACLRVDPARTSRSIPLLISITVIVERCRVGSRAPSHAITSSVPCLCRPGASTEATLVSKRYTLELHRPRARPISSNWNLGRHRHQPINKVRFPLGLNVRSLLDRCNPCGRATILRNNRRLALFCRIHQRGEFRLCLSQLHRLHQHLRDYM